VFPRSAPLLMLAAAGAAVPAPAVSPVGGCRLAVHRTALERPAAMVSCGVVRGEVLFVPDSFNGLRRIDLRTGKDLPFPEVSSLPFSPQGLGVSGRNTFWIAGSGNRLARWSPDGGVVWREKGLAALGVVVPLAGRAVAVGWVSAARCGEQAELFEIGGDGSCTPLLPWPEDHEEGIRRFSFSWTSAGGLARTPGGGFLLLDPVRGVVIRYDTRSRPAGSWRLANPRWRPPDLDAMPMQVDAVNRESFFRWFHAQAVASRPAVLADGTVAVVLSLPGPDGTIVRQVDLYGLDGEPKAIGVPLPAVPERRVIVTDADGGRLVLLTQERDWPPGSPTAIVTVEVTGGRRADR